MPKLNLKQVISSGRSTLAQATGSLENIAGSGGTGSLSLQGGIIENSLSGNFNFLLNKKISENRINSALKELYRPNGGKVVSPIVFPQDLDNNYYMIYNVMKKRRTSRDVRGIADVRKSIVLPIPSNLIVNYGVNYANERLGIFGAGAANRLDPGVGDLAQEITSKASQIMNSLKAGDTDAAIQAASISAPLVSSLFAGRLAGSLAGLLTLGGTGGNVLTGISVDTGIALNPHLAVVFENVGFRQFQFNYKFVARNTTESRLIKNIINTFRYHMHPDFAGGNLAFEYPDEFHIQFSESLSEHMFKIEDSVLTNFSVSYNGESIPIFYEDTNAPVSIEISMTFQETRILTKEAFLSDGETGYESPNSAEDWSGGPF